METNMQPHALPRETFNLLVEAFGERQKAEIFAKAIESAIVAIDNKTTAGIVEKKEMIKIEVREELRKELVTRELFEEVIKNLGKEMKERFNGVDEKFKNVDEKFKSMQIGINERFNVVEAKFQIVDEKFKSLQTVISERFNGVDEKFKAVDEKFKSLNFKLNLFIAIALIALTFANPTFVALIQKLF